MSRHRAAELENKKYHSRKYHSECLKLPRAFNIYTRLTVGYTVQAHGESMIFTPPVQLTEGRCIHTLHNLRSAALKQNKTEKPRVCTRLSCPPKPDPHSTLQQQRQKKETSFNLNKPRQKENPNHGEEFIHRSWGRYYYIFSSRTAHNARLFFSFPLAIRRCAS